MLFIVILLATVASISASVVKEPECDCDMSREDIGKWLMRHADLNCDGSIDLEEISQLRKKNLWLIERWLSSKHPPEEIMEHCDVSKDGKISLADFNASKDTCLNECSGRKDFVGYIINRANAYKYNAGNECN